MRSNYLFYILSGLQYFKEFYSLFHYIVRIRNYCSLFKNSYPLIMDNKLIGNNATNSIQANASLWHSISDICNIKILKNN